MLAAALASCTPARGRMLEGEIRQAAQTGGRIDLARLFRAPWDRVCVLLPYIRPAMADSLLGFHFSGAGELAGGDGIAGVVFVRAGRVAAFARVARDGADFAADPHVTGRGYCLPRDRAVFQSMPAPGASGRRVVLPLHDREP
jgi:hypothetical protein